jgi:RNA polymerase sigma-70 factor (ECF subfamily)
MDHKQFSERVRGMEHTLHRISRGILSREADCEDASQEAVLKAWKWLDTLRNEDKFEAWLIRILINECRKQRRSFKRHSHAELTDSMMAPSAPNPALHDAFFALGEKYRLPLTLHYLDGYRIDEIARILDVPKGTIKSRLHRGLELLETQLNEEV